MRESTVCNVAERTKGIYRVKRKSGQIMEIKAVSRTDKSISICALDNDKFINLKFDRYGRNDDGDKIVFEGYPTVVIVVDEPGDERYVALPKIDSSENKSDIIHRLKKLYGKSLHSIMFPEKDDGLK